MRYHAERGNEKAMSEYEPLSGSARNVEYSLQLLCAFLELVPTLLGVSPGGEQSHHGPTSLNLFAGFWYVREICLRWLHPRAIRRELYQSRAYRIALPTIPAGIVKLAGTSSCVGSNAARCSVRYGKALNLSRTSIEAV